jgi:hypothetical protein
MDGLDRLLQEPANSEFATVFSEQCCFYSEKVTDIVLTSMSDKPRRAGVALTGKSEGILWPLFFHQYRGKSSN